MTRLARALAVVPFALCACGGDKPAAKPPVAAAPSASAMPSAKPQSTATGFLASDVPMATMPPPFDFGSKKAEIRMYSASDSAKAACASSVATNASPTADVGAIVKACAAPTSLKPSGAVLSGSQKPDAVAQKFPFAAQAGHCYRAYGSAAPSVTDFSVFVLDSAGATAASGHSEGARAIAPANGSVCFKENDAAQIVVTIGRGAGTFAVQVTSD
ncbi:MAG TPA: hypothetical protein VF407_09790 [Polyangiaceae bacterium]